MKKKLYLYLLFFSNNILVNDIQEINEQDYCIDKIYIPNIQSLFVLPNDPFVGVGRFDTVEGNELIIHHNALIENNLILNNNLIVKGNTILGDQDFDTTNIRGIVSINTIGAGSTTIGNSTDAGSFIVRCSPLNSMIFTTGDGVLGLSNNGSISFVLNGLNVVPGVPAPNSFNVAMADSEMNFIHFNLIDHDGINGQVHRIIVLAQPGVKGGDIFVGAQTDSINQGGQIQIATFTGDSNNVLGGSISLSTGCGNGTGSKTGDINFSTGANNSDNQISGNINISTGSGDGNSSTAGNINCNIAGGNGINQQIGSYSFNSYLGDGNNHQGGNFNVNLNAGNGLGSQGGGINMSTSAGDGDNSSAGNINCNISGGNGINQQIGSYSFGSYLGDGNNHQGGNFNVNLNAGNGLGAQGGGINMSTSAGNGDNSSAGSINCNISGGNGIAQQIGSYNLNTYLGDGDNNQGGHFSINLTAGNGLNAVGGSFTVNLNGNSNSDNTGSGQATFNLGAGNSNNSPGGNFNINMNGGNGQSCYGGNININLNAGNGTNANGGSFFVTTNPGGDVGSYGGDIRFVTNSNGIANTGKILLQGNSSDPDAIQLEGNILLNLTNQSLKISNIPLATTTLLYIDNNGTVSKDASSKRYKQDIEDLVVDELDLLQSIPHEKTFKFISKPDIPCIGYIAEDFDEQENSVLKGMVNYNSEGLPESLQYRDLFVIAVAALKKLHQRVLELESVVYNLKS